VTTHARTVCDLCGKAISPVLAHGSLRFDITETAGMDGATDGWGLVFEDLCNVCVRKVAASLRRYRTDPEDEGHG
jgi:hypothetical protein